MERVACQRLDWHTHLGQMRAFDPTGPVSRSRLRSQPEVEECLQGAQSRLPLRLLLTATRALEYPAVHSNGHDEAAVCPFALGTLRQAGVSQAGPQVIEQDDGTGLGHGNWRWGKAGISLPGLYNHQVQRVAQTKRARQQLTLGRAAAVSLETFEQRVREIGLVRGEVGGRVAQAAHGQMSLRGVGKLDE